MLGRAYRAGALGALLGVWLGLACDPQELYLFELAPAPVADAGSSNAGNGGTAGGGGNGGEPEPPGRMPPDCESEACQECLGSATPCLSDANLFCHPRTGECVLGCDAEARPEQGRVCPLGQVCDPDDDLCVECVDSDDCPEPRSVCNPDTQRCVECIGGSGCPVLGEVCHPERLQCVECVTVADCADDDDQFCFESRCVECRTSQDCDPDRPSCSLEFECEDEY